MNPRLLLQFRLVPFSTSPQSGHKVGTGCLKSDEDGFIIGRYEADLIVGNRFIIELKHCDKLAPVHVAQLINYLCTTGIEHGLLINFGSPKFEIVKRIYTKKQPQGEALT